MSHLLPCPALLALALVGLASCHQETDEVQPAGGATLLGEWHLTESGGGFTGIMTPAPANAVRLVLRADSTYALYQDGKLAETNAFRLKSYPSYAGGPNEPRLLLKTTRLGPQLAYYPYYLTALTATELRYTTGGGCAMNYVYQRIGNAPQPTAGH